MMTGRADFTAIVLWISRLGNWTDRLAIKNTILAKHSAIRKARKFLIWSTVFQVAGAMRAMPDAFGIVKRRLSSARAEVKTEILAPIIMIARRQPAALWTASAARLICGNAKGKI